MLGGRAKRPGPSGAARDRGRERDDPQPRGPGAVPQAQLDYLLQTGLPGRWIPYLPRSSGYRAIELIQGRMAPDIAPLGRLLNTDAVKRLKDAEVPREGVLVRRLPSTARRSDGSWLDVDDSPRGRRERGGASRLAFDSAIARKPRPNAPPP